MIPFITINLDKPRKLRFGMGAMSEFEQLTGMKLQDIDEDMPLEMAAKILWVMLKQEDPDLTLRDVYQLVDDHADSIQSVISKVAEAVVVAFSPEGKRPNAPTPAKKPGSHGK